MTKKKNPQDATLRNIRALKTKVTEDRNRIKELERQVRNLNRAIVEIAYDMQKEKK